ncbi:HsdM family class I SAM-dependent methyltransferase [Lactobacillus mulieris]|uniref:site-specific DNA-methyltransferase (adenine-specific) n=1 Tax=Lactobacillus mulieris TaxID=2508708 RepID=A0AAW5X0N0_9LACO|nr:N-6 DNA methylase [Lactobacillus mulieris]MCZ3622831.1 SAM-dependent methyltransferase [Lactobacillus mulieris]MCZ3624511.1 SAM-dependent methyltransferase [Lactobacillus mulieris]MCZ3636828.1 SAM-dependent methyltransferase [Lactobacillus mulieris]MCZ3690756.1 SAM-dependent methyltransferase [Lactobacillus mulieris]MCZ3696727.1 SAM-dependent methyltransferase [Lactobacillus mulieris]
MSVEEKVEEYFKAIFDKYEIRHFAKTESINNEIDDALKNTESKSGGKGNNYPDIKLLLEDNHSRRIPVMIEAKGGKNKLEKLDKNGHIVQVTKFGSDSNPGSKNPHKKGDPNYSAITTYAVNGAYHYGNAILRNTSYEEVLFIGINGTTLKDSKLIDPEIKAYYVSEKNNYVPKVVNDLNTPDSLVLLASRNLDKFYKILDDLTLTDKEIEEVKAKTENELEAKIKAIHQRIYDDKAIKNILSTNDKLYAFTGLIMAGLATEGIQRLQIDEFKSNNSDSLNDGKIVLEHIRSFLEARNASKDKIDMILSLLGNVFKSKSMWQPVNGESLIKGLYRQISTEIIPLLESNLHLDFTGKILNSLSDWVSIENDNANDVVLTPGYVTKFMAHLARTNKDSFVWDIAMGSGGFLVSAMDVMIKDARESIKDTQELEAKIKNIKSNQLLGIEILGNIYILAVLNMILMGDGSSNLYREDSHDTYLEHYKHFPATVFLLNPPYSAPGKGFNFVEEALSQMTRGYAAILIQENAGSGNGLPYTERILKNNTLVASIHMPNDLFSGKASVQTAIYVFKVAQPHDKDNLVTFIDMSEDGYSRQNRKKSSQEVNLRDTDHAKDRYAEVEAIILGKKPKTQYYTEANGKLIRDTIGLTGDDWTFSQHQVIDTTPTEEDFKKVVAEYLSWKVSQLLEDGEYKND